jgi:hypothetical protein
MKDAQEFFTSSVSHRKYQIILGDKKCLDCTTSNIIYLVTCQRCKMQYVGETRQKFASRMNNHRSNIISKAEILIYQHFNGPCTMNHFFAQPIEKIIGDGLKTTQLRKKRETFWIKELRTMFPYGLNDRCVGKDWGKNTDTIPLFILIQFKLNGNTEDLEKIVGTNIL